MSGSDGRESTSKRFTGTEEGSVDAKGRIQLSKKTRGILGEVFAIAVGETGCIRLFPLEKWEKYLGRFESTDPLNEGRQWFARLLFGTADDEVSCDGQGRVVIPKRLRDLGRISEEVELVGCGDYVEIWDPKEFLASIENPSTYGDKRRQILMGAKKEMGASGSAE